LTFNIEHYLLTALLLAALQAAAPARVIVLSSSAHLRSDIDFDDIHYRHCPLYLVAHRMGYKNRKLVRLSLGPVHDGLLLTTIVKLARLVSMWTFLKQIVQDHNG
jgi:hypothetical protein